MKDVVNNYKICNMRTLASQGVSAADQLVVDLQEAVSTHLGQRERVTRGILIVIVTAVASGGTLDIVAKDSYDGTTYDADFATLTQIDATGVYFCDLKDIQKTLKLYATVATAAVTWGAIFVGVENRRAPVKQTDATELSVTYGTGR